MINDYVLKNSSDNYIVNCDASGNGGYNVVPRTIDPSNAYTIEEVEAYLAEHPEMLLDFETIEAKRLEKAARAKRDSLLKETVDSVNPMRWEAMSDEQKDSWRVYRQALLDVPQQEGFPTNIVWPEAPNE